MGLTTRATRPKVDNFLILSAATFPCGELLQSISHVWAPRMTLQIMRLGRRQLGVRKLLLCERRTVCIAYDGDHRPSKAVRGHPCQVLGECRSQCPAYVGLVSASPAHLRAQSESRHRTGGAAARALVHRRFWSPGDAEACWRYGRVNQGDRDRDGRRIGEEVHVRLEQRQDLVGSCACRCEQVDERRQQAAWLWPTSDPDAPDEPPADPGGRKKIPRRRTDRTLATFAWRGRPGSGGAWSSCPRHGWKRRKHRAASRHKPRTVT